MTAVDEDKAKDAGKETEVERDRQSRACPRSQQGQVGPPQVAADFWGHGHMTFKLQGLACTGVLLSADRCAVAWCDRWQRMQQAVISCVLFPLHELWYLQLRHPAVEFSDWCVQEP